MRRPQDSRRKRLFAVAAGIGVLGVGLAPVDAQAAPQASEGREIVSPSGEYHFEDGDVMNYAVNLVQGASAQDLEQAVGAAQAVGGVVLAQYPDLGTFFVQAASWSFAGDLANSLAGVGLGFDSIGPTRQNPITGQEVVLPDNAGPRVAGAARSTSSHTGLSVDENSQLAEVTPIH